MSAGLLANMIPCTMFFRPGWHTRLHPRAGWGGESDYRWAGGLGTFMALASVPAVLRHASLRGCHPWPVVGYHRQPLLQTVSPSVSKPSDWLSAVCVSKPKFLFVNSYKKASMWIAVVGMHDLENANESCHQVRVCVYIYISLPSYVIFSVLSRIFAVVTLLCILFKDRNGGKNHLPQGLQPKDKWEWYCPAETAESTAVWWVCETCWHLEQGVGSSGKLHCHGLGCHQREYAFNEACAVKTV